MVLNTIKQTNSKTCCRGQPLFRLAAVLTCCTCLLVLLRHKAINIISDFKGVFSLHISGENHWPATDKLYHMMLYTLPWSRFELTTSVVIVSVLLVMSCFWDYCVQWNLCNPTPEFSDILWHLTKIYSTKVFLCQIVQDVRTCQIRHTKGPGKCVRLYRMSEPV
jgi:hypothetical protein